jgi:tetratricopeptide (TPR) repeat protein
VRLIEVFESLQKAEKMNVPPTNSIEKIDQAIAALERFKLRLKSDIWRPVSRYQAVEFREILQFLYAEKERLDKAIAALKKIDALLSSERPGRPPRTLGLQSKNKKHQHVSTRMSHSGAGREEALAESNPGEPGKPLLEEMQSAHKAYKQAAEEHMKIREKYGNMLDHSDTTSALHQAATNERLAAQRYKQAVKAYQMSLKRQAPPRPKL